MDRAERDVLLQRLSRQTALHGASRAAKLRRLPLRLLLPRLLRVTGTTRRATATTFFGRRMQVHLPDLVGTELYRYGFFEADLTRSIINLLPSGGVFVDIGAHVGYYSVLASLLVGPRGRVVAFEPTPRTRTELSQNTTDLDNVTIVPLAAWDEPTTLVLQDFGWRQSSFNSVMAPRLRGRPSRDNIDVGAIPVDDWLERHDVVPSLIKIDAESAEHRVLNGLRRTIQRHRPILSLELGDYNLPGVPRSAELVRMLIASGYDAWQNLDGRLVEHRVADYYGYDNLIFLPGRRADGLIAARSQAAE